MIYPGLIEEREEINKKILATRSERVKKKQLRRKYADKKREVKTGIRSDKRKWMDDIAKEQKMLQVTNI